MYGVLRSKSCLLSAIARNLKDEAKIENVIDRLSNRLANFDENEKAKIMGNYYDEIMEY